MFPKKISQNIDILARIHGNVFHGNQLSWGIKHPLINLWSKYHSLAFIHFSTMLAPIISSLDEIYCISIWLSVCLPVSVCLPHLFVCLSVTMSLHVHSLSWSSHCPSPLSFLVADLRLLILNLPCRLICPSVTKTKYDVFLLFRSWSIFSIIE